MFLKFLRNGLGYVFIFISLLIPIKKVKRSKEQQNEVDDACLSLSLYQFYPCPFCLKTRRVLKQLRLSIKTRDATKDPARSELLSGGGQIKVPCLKIEAENNVTWMYESDEIIKYLEQRFKIKS